MIDLIALARELMNTTPERRAEILMQLYYVSRGNMEMHFAAITNEPPDSPVYRQAWDNLTTLRDYLDERLRAVTPPTEDTPND